MQKKSFPLNSAKTCENLHTFEFTEQGLTGEPTGKPFELHLNKIKN